MKKTLPIIFIVFVFLFIRPVFASSPHFFLSPTSGSKSGTFNIDVKVDSGGQNVSGADVYLSYPKNLLRVDNFTKATGDDKAFTQIYPLIKNDEGRLRVFAYFASSDVGQSFSGAAGLIGTINFTVLSGGTAKVELLCSPGVTNDSNIYNKADSTDIIICSANVNGMYTISTVGGTTVALTPTPSIVAGASLTPTPTTTSGATVTPSTAQISPTTPVTGTEDYTYGIIGFGFVILLTGSLWSIRMAKERA
jgi:hypothetical protein